MLEGHKFQFDEEFQEDILQLLVTDIKLGPKAMYLIDPDYFGLVEHNIIALAVKTYFTENKRVPGKSVLKEYLRQLFRDIKFKNILTTDDKENILKLVNKLYSRNLRDADGVFDNIKRFARFSAVSDVLENIDLNDFTSYQNYSSQLKKAINLGVELEDGHGMLIVEQSKERVSRRGLDLDVYETPFWQLNGLLNNHGTTTGNLITVLGPAKRFKTGFLLNLAKGYMRLKRNVLIADFENGEDALSLRFDQAMIRATRDELRSGELDSKLLRQYRKYKRIGSELAIKRFRAGDTAEDILRHIENIKSNYGITITDLIVDYADLMGAVNGERDETKKIHQTYIDLKNIGEECQLCSIWTPSHITREGDKHQSTKYKANDIAKAIDKIRDADLILGLNQSEEEMEAGVIRAEIIEQRDGPQNGRAWFHIDINTQYLKEFTKQEAKAANQRWEELLSSQSKEEEPPKGSGFGGKVNDL